MRVSIVAAAFLAMAGTAQAQISYDQYGNRWDFYRGSVDPNPAFRTPDYSFSVPSLPPIPALSSPLDSFGPRDNTPTIIGPGPDLFGPLPSGDE